jgi:hypothetical protein
MSTDIKKLAEQLAKENGLKAYEYDLALRDIDNSVELIGLVNDPTVSMDEFIGREMLFPKRWLTLKVFDEEHEVTV